MARKPKPSVPEQPAEPPFEHDFIFLRSAPLDGRTAHEYIEGGFSWPLEAGGIVEAPDWDPNPSRDCGGGLHGLPSGLGDWGLLRSPSDPSTLWYVCGARAEESVQAGGKVRVRRCRVLFVGDFGGAMHLITPAMTSATQALVRASYSGAASNSGDSGVASNSGYRGVASNSGYSGAASSVGKDGVAVAAGTSSRGMVAYGSLLVLVERDQTGAMVHYFAGREGERGVAAHRWYELRGGTLVDVTGE